MAAQYVIRLVPTPGRQAVGTPPNQAQQFLVTATGVSVASLKVEIEKVSHIPSREQELIFSEYSVCRILADVRVTSHVNSVQMASH